METKNRGEKVVLRRLLRDMGRKYVSNKAEENLREITKEGGEKARGGRRLDFCERKKKRRRPQNPWRPDAGSVRKADRISTRQQRDRESVGKRRV